MAPAEMRLVREPIGRGGLLVTAEAGFGNLVKAVVDVARSVMAIGGELHSDEEALLLDDGSLQQDLWGINLHPAEPGADWIEVDSMINVRSSRDNRSQSVDDATPRERIRIVVERLVAG